MKPRKPNDQIDSALKAYPAGIRKRILALRKLILSTAASIESVGTIEETLKWGEPAYLTTESKSGSTIRLGWKASSPKQYAMYLNCRTTLVDTYRTLYPELKYDGNRAVLFDTDDDLPTDSVTHCIEMALTYHLAKRSSKKAHSG